MEGRAHIAGSHKLPPVISDGTSKPRSRRAVGARSDSSPSSFSVTSPDVSDERNGVRRVRRVRADAVRLQHLLGVAVVGGDEADAAGGVRRLDDVAEALVGRPRPPRHGGDRAGVADHVRIREVDRRRSGSRLPISAANRARDLAGGHLRLVVVARHVARARDEDPRLPRPLVLDAAVEEVRDVGVLLRLGDVQLPGAGGREHLGERVGDLLLAEGDGHVELVASSASSSSGRSPPRAASPRAGAPRSGRKLKKIAASSGAEPRRALDDDRLEELVGDAGVVAPPHLLEDAGPARSASPARARSRRTPFCVRSQRASRSIA